MGKFPCNFKKYEGPFAIFLFFSLNFSFSFFLPVVGWPGPFRNHLTRPSQRGTGGVLGFPPTAGGCWLGARANAWYDTVATTVTRRRVVRPAGRVPRGRGASGVGGNTEVARLSCDCTALSCPAEPTRCNPARQRKRTGTTVWVPMGCATRRLVRGERCGDGARCVGPTAVCSCGGRAVRSRAEATHLAASSTRPKRLAHVAGQAWGITAAAAC